MRRWPETRAEIFFEDHGPKIKRFDMPGFHPNEHYVREMKRFGILPADHGPGSAIDVYATDQAFWRSTWYRPGGE